VVYGLVLETDETTLLLSLSDITTLSEQVPI
jgi:hypothetical protein